MTAPVRPIPAETLREWADDVVGHDDGEAYRHRRDLAAYALALQEAVRGVLSFSYDSTSRNPHHHAKHYALRSAAAALLPADEDTP